MTDLVDDETGWKRGDSTTWHGNCLATYGTPERTDQRPTAAAAASATGSSSQLRIHDMLQTALAHLQHK